MPFPISVLLLLLVTLNPARSEKSPLPWLSGFVLLLPIPPPLRMSTKSCWVWKSRIRVTTSSSASIVSCSSINSRDWWRLPNLRQVFSSKANDVLGELSVIDAQNRSARINSAAFLLLLSPKHSSHYLLYSLSIGNVKAEKKISIRRKVELICQTVWHESVTFVKIGRPVAEWSCHESDDEKDEDNVILANESNYSL